MAVTTGEEVSQLSSYGAVIVLHFIVSESRAGEFPDYYYYDDVIIITVRFSGSHTMFFILLPFRCGIGVDKSSNAARAVQYSTGQSFIHSPAKR